MPPTFLLKGTILTREERKRIVKHEKCVTYNKGLKKPLILKKIFDLIVHWIKIEAQDLA